MASKMTGVDKLEESKQNIDNVLNFIYNLGDRDEESDKHLGHGLAAIASGQSYRDVVAFPTPWKVKDEDDAGSLNKHGDWNTDVKHITLEKYWDIVQAEFRKIGQKDFIQLVEELQEPYFSGCLVYYLPAVAPDSA